MVPSAESVQDLADESLKETVIDMLNLAEDLSLFILNSRPRSSYERLRRVAISSDRGERIGAYVSRFKDLRREFDTRIGVQGLRGSAADRQVAETDRINAKLRELKPANLAGYDPARQCIPGTRLELTDELAVWARASDGGPRLAWVKGPAGFGKSSIATSLCVRLSEHKALASSFFCKRDAADLRDPRRVLTTVVYGMASRWEAYREAVARAIGEDLDLHSKHVQPLYESLVTGPIRSLDEAMRPRSTLAIIVDALDECGDTTTRRQLLGCLRNMAQLGPWLRIVVTSRPDLDIQEFFESAGQDWFTSFDVLKHDASADIAVFVQNELSGMACIPNWPDDAVDQIHHGRSRPARTLEASLSRKPASRHRFAL
ncbi:hypothetical protein FRC07_000760 [Ceratobasidium sp. 392]|nr:hypothetical protein FRC07_000760 [Ceratobasidium sp. 392]